jgi:hypothetical protein
MASNGYPKVTAKAWRALRTRAAAAPSTKFTPSTVAALMGMATPESARDNTVSPMRRLGLIEEDGALTPRGNKWRVDASYADACQEILDEVYPADLSALADGSGAPDPQLVKTWFDHKGFGGSNSRQMAATYVMIAGKQLPEALATEPRKATAKKVAATATAAPKSRSTSKPEDPPAATSSPEPPRATSGTGPNVHLDIQIHIPADASAEQIDQIFESMARHLYKQ